MIRHLSWAQCLRFNKKNRYALNRKGVLMADNRSVDDISLPQDALIQQIREIVGAVETNMSAKFASVDQKLALMSNKFTSLEADMSAKFASVDQKLALMSDKFASLESDFSDMKRDLGRLDRTVSAIESLPVPYGRPKTFHRATEVQSVSGGKTKRLGHLT